MVPPKSDPRWKQLVAGEIKPRFEFLALSILMQKVAEEMRASSSPSTMQKSIDLVHSFFVKFERLAENDLRKVFG